MVFRGIKYLTLLPWLHSNRTYIIYNKTYLKRVKTDANCNELTGHKYHINATGIIKLIPIKRFTHISNSVILQREALSDLWWTHRAFERNQRLELGILRQERGGGKDNFKVGKPCHQAKKKKKTRQKYN